MKFKLIHIDNVSPNTCVYDIRYSIHCLHVKRVIAVSTKLFSKFLWKHESNKINDFYHSEWPSEQNILLASKVNLQCLIYNRLKELSTITKIDRAALIGRTAISFLKFNCQKMYHGKKRKISLMCVAFLTKLIVIKSHQWFQVYPFIPCTPCIPRH